jgi:multiple sugar transport system substrate-binding protein
MSSGSLEEWAENNLLYNLDSLIENDDTKDKFYSSLLDSAKQISGGDHYYALPFALVTFPLYYNKDAFDAAGIAYPTDDWTWDDFRSAAKALTIDKDGNGSIDQWGFWFYGRYAHIEPWVYANDGNLIDRDTMRYNPDENALEAIKMLTDLVLVDKVAPQPKEMSAYRQQDLFPKGVSAMFIDGSWNINNNRLVADPSMNWGIATVPKGPSATVGYTYGYPDSYAMAPNTENPQEAWEFTRYVAGEGLSLDTFMAGKIPAYKALTESDEFIDPNQKPAEMYILTEQAGSPMQSSFTKGWGEWRGYAAAASLGFNGVIDGILNGEIQYNDGMEGLLKSVNVVLKRYYK